MLYIYIHIMYIMVVRINLNINNIVITIIIITAITIINIAFRKHMQSTYIFATTHANHLNKCKIRGSSVSHVYSHVYRGTSDNT